MKSTIFSAYYVVVSMWKDSLEGNYPDNLDLTAPFIEDLVKLADEETFGEFVKSEDGKIFVDLLEEQILYPPYEDEEELEEHTKDVKEKFIKLLERIVHYPLDKLVEEMKKNEIL